MYRKSGQQISWLAARSIAHKFLRLFNPSIPVLPPDTTEEYVTTKCALGGVSFLPLVRPIKFFPSPKDVADASIESLRIAGLSQRKAEYGEPP
jgi:DNA-3-methyladenine glycosylase II